VCVAVSSIYNFDYRRTAFYFCNEFLISAQNINEVQDKMKRRIN
jgi:hypothetical protein